MKIKRAIFCLLSKKNPMLLYGGKKKKLKIMDAVNLKRGNLIISALNLTAVTTSSSYFTIK
jgi:hypothetical protein